MNSSDSFSSEWLAVGDHRIRIECRDGAPCAYVRRMAMLVVWHIEGRYELDVSNIRLASIFYNNRHCSAFHFTFGALSGDPDAREAAIDAFAAACQFFGLDEAQVNCEIVDVPAGCTVSDSYDHTEHLTLNALGRKVGP